MNLAVHETNHAECRLQNVERSLRLTLDELRAEFNKITRNLAAPASQDRLPRSADDWTILCNWLGHDQCL